MDFVKAEQVLVKQNVSSREEMLRAVADRAQALGVTNDADAVYAAFIARESMGPTGMKEGFAVPHAKSAAIERAAVVVFKNETPLEWPSFDEMPVNTAIALCVPDGEAGSTHMRLLSKTAVMLMREDFRAAVRATDDPARIASLINEGIEED
jgi:PTS system fructose-specific IIA component